MNQCQTWTSPYQIQTAFCALDAASIALDATPTTAVPALPPLRRRAASR